MLIDLFNKIKQINFNGSPEDAGIEDFSSLSNSDLIGLGDLNAIRSANFDDLRKVSDAQFNQFDKGIQEALLNRKSELQELEAIGIPSEKTQKEAEIYFDQPIQPIQPIQQGGIPSEVIPAEVEDKISIDQAIDNPELSDVRDALEVIKSDTPIDLSEDESEGSQEGDEEGKPKEVPENKKIINNWVDAVARGIVSITGVPSEIKKRVQELLDEKRAKAVKASPPTPPDGDDPEGNGTKKDQIVSNEGTKEKPNPTKVGGPENINQSSGDGKENLINYLELLNSIGPSVLEKEGNTQMANLTKEIINRVIENSELPPILQAKLIARGRSLAESLTLEERNIPEEKGLIEKEKSKLNVERNLAYFKLGLKLAKSAVIVGGAAGLLAVGIGPFSPIFIGVGTGLISGVLDYKINPSTIGLRIEAQKKLIEKNKKDQEKIKLDMNLQKSHINNLNKLGNIIVGNLGKGDEEFKKNFFRGIDFKTLEAAYAV